MPLPPSQPRQPRQGSTMLGNTTLPSADQSDPPAPRGNWEGIVPQGPPASPPEPIQVVQGALVDYYSESHKTWIPAKIVNVNAETGGVELDRVELGKFFSPEEQRRCLRARTRPSPERLKWIRQRLRDGTMHEESMALFNRYAHRNIKPIAIRPESIPAVGQEIDAMLGVSGSFVSLTAVHIHNRSWTGHGFINIDDFQAHIWEIVWNTVRAYESALERKHFVHRKEGDPGFAYTYDRELGSGTFGSVDLAVCRTTKVKRAIKRITKDSFAGTGDIDNEIEHLCTLDHPHIVKLYEHFDCGMAIHLVMDYCAGGELASAISKCRRGSRKLEDGFVASVMSQILSAISYVHVRGMMHLDIKSQNIMLMMPLRDDDQPDAPHAMLIDLGIAQAFTPGNFRHNRPCGTPSTMAPEVWEGTVTPKADIFSLGVVLFEMLSLSLPFDIHSVSTREMRAFWGEMPEVPWNRATQASDGSVQLCQRMLDQDRNARPTASECLQLPYVAIRPGVQEGASTFGSLPTYAEHFLKYAAKTDLHRSVAMQIARAWPANELTDLRRLYLELDIEGHGYLHKNQFVVALERLGVARAQADAVANAMDLTRDGTIHWSEFCAASIDLADNERKKDLYNVFRKADRDGDGRLSKEDIVRLLVADGMRGEEAVQDIFNELVGSQEEGATCDIGTFCKYLRGHDPHSIEAGATRLARQMGYRQSDPNPPRRAAAPRAAEPQPAPNAPARGLLGLVSDLVFNSSAAPSDTIENNMKRLAEMGLTNQASNLAALKKHGNVVNDALISELLSKS